MTKPPEPRRRGVIDECCGLLTNFEVMQLLRSQTAARTKEETRAPLTGARRTSSSLSLYQTQQLAYAASINEDVVKFLEESCCAEQSAESIAAFMQSCEPFKLKRTELLNLINEQPRSLVEIHLIVEECEERLTPEQMKTLLEKVQILAAENGEAAPADIAGAIGSDGARDGATDRPFSRKR